MANNHRRLKDEASIKDVVAELGIPVEKKGSAYFMHCPRPDHNDNSPSAYFKDGWNNVHCNSCGRSTYAIDLIQWTLGVSFGDACDKLWAIEGYPDWYKERKLPKMAKPEFELKFKQAAVLGIELPRAVACPKNEYAEKIQCVPLARGERYAGAETYILMKDVPVTWKDFISEGDLKEMIVTRFEDGYPTIARFGIGERDTWMNLDESQETRFMAHLNKIQASNEIKFRLVETFLADKENAMTPALLNQLAIEYSLLGDYMSMQEIDELYGLYVSCKAYVTMKKSA